VIWGAENAKVDQGVIQDLKREELAKTAPTPDNGVVAPVKKKKPAPKPDVAAAPEPSAPGRQAQTVEAVKIADNSLNKPIGSQLAPAQGGAPASPGSGAWGYSIPKTTAAKTADGRTCRQVQTVTFSGTDRYDHVSDMCLTPEGQWLADTQNGADKNKG